MKHSLPKATRTSTRTKALVTGGLVALTAAGVGGAGVGGAAFAAFTGTTNAAQSVASGTVSLAGIGTDAAGNRLTVGATNIAAGDTIQRAVTLTNTGTIDMAGITLTTTATTSSLLDTDAVNGLQMTIDKCSTAWTESAIPLHLHLRRHHLVGAGQHPGDRLRPGPDATSTLDGRRHQQPARHPDPAGRCRQHAPEPDVGHRLHLHRHPARRHRPVTQRH